MELKPKIQAIFIILTITAFYDILKSKEVIFMKEELSTGWRVFIAILCMLVFGFLTVFFGTDSWTQVLQNALLGTIALFVVLIR